MIEATIIDGPASPLEKFSCLQMRRMRACR